MPRHELDHAFRALQDLAKEKGASLHKSFFEELENYTRHKGVEDLSEAELERVILVVGEEAISHAPGEEVGGKSIRETLNDICWDPFSTCLCAAERILGMEGESSARSVIEEEPAVYEGTYEGYTIGGEEAEEAEKEKSAEREAEAGAEEDE